MSPCTINPKTKKPYRHHFTNVPTGPWRYRATCTRCGQTEREVNMLRECKQGKFALSKTIKSIEEEMYGTFLLVTFIDGTYAQFAAGSSGCHNEVWSTVRIKKVD